MVFYLPQLIVSSSLLVFLISICLAPSGMKVILATNVAIFSARKHFLLMQLMS